MQSCSEPHLSATPVPAGCMSVHACAQRARPVDHTCPRWLHERACKRAASRACQPHLSPLAA
eukprot:32411-Chlamydomonas_euryale.AAC.2